MKRAIRIILICVAALVAVTIGAAAFRALDFTDPITLSLNGQQVIYLEYGQEYQEPGATAVIPEKDEAVPVTIPDRWTPPVWASIPSSILPAPTDTPALNTVMFTL